MAAAIAQLGGSEPILLGEDEAVDAAPVVPCFDLICLITGPNDDQTYLELLKSDLRSAHKRATVEAVSLEDGRGKLAGARGRDKRCAKWARRHARSVLGVSSEDGQAAIALVGAVLTVFVATALFAQFGSAFVAKGRDQRTADHAALAAAKQMSEDHWRAVSPPTLPGGSSNPTYMSTGTYKARARARAHAAASANKAGGRIAGIAFKGGHVPSSVVVSTVRDHRVEVPGDGSGRTVRVAASATAELRFSFGALPDPRPGEATGGGYSGPLAYRQGKPMRPDVAAAFDRMAAAARAEGHSLVINSAFRSDAEQARLFAQRPDPKWVAPPGTSLHRYGTELDLAPPSAYGWLAANARRFGFIKRYAWEPWHFGFGANPRDVPAQYERGSYEPKNGNFSGDGDLPAWVPARYRPMIADSAQRHNLQPILLAAQLKAESDFNPNAVSPAGAQGIAQFMPGTAASVGLRDPFDPRQAINAQGKLMAGLLRQFKSIPLALAAYNAGPGAVQRYNGIPPYGETQAYVAKILALMKGSGAELDDPAFAGISIEAEVALVR